MGIRFEGSDDNIFDLIKQIQYNITSIKIIEFIKYPNKVIFFI